MILCKSCRSEIESDSKVCKYCRSYQRWYRNPQFYSYLFVFPFIFFMFYQTAFFSKKEFIDFSDQFTMETINLVSIKNTSRYIINANVTNKTKYKWHAIHFEVIGRLDDKVIMIKSGEDYDWVIQPDSESMISIPFKNESGEDLEWEVNIKDLSHDRY